VPHSTRPTTTCSHPACVAGQVKTSLDYDHESAITRYLSGALNYQVRS
jgi:hypothetical protein